MEVGRFLMWKAVPFGSSIIKWLSGSLCSRFRRNGPLLLGLATVIAIIMALTLPRIAQDPGYHQFADHRSYMGIPHCLNVISNLPFALLGYLGLRSVLRRNTLKSGAVIEDRREQWSYSVFYLGMVLTGFGSAYYHLWPDHDRLVWDRLAMMVAFMSFLATIISERISVRAGFLLLLPFLITGVGTVVFWIAGEHRAMGDLRPYILAQYFPMLLIPIILLLFPSRYTKGGYILAMLLLYSLAKIAEMHDGEIFSLGQVMSGHTLKHLLAGMAIYCHLRMLSRRIVRVHGVAGRGG